MEERRISESDVETALNRTIGRPMPGTRPGSIVFRGHAVGGRIIKVITRLTDKNYVITVAREE